jgi:peptidyl-prolyl cis-trans isomerase SurA
MSKDVKTLLKHFISRIHVAAAIAVVCAAAAYSPARAQQVAVVVNGSPITSFDIEQRMKLIQVASHKSASRQEALEDLINDRVKIAEGKRYGLDPTDAEVDQAVAGMGARMRMNQAQFTQALAAQGVNLSTLKLRIRGELVWGQLVRGRYASSLQVDDKDVADAIGSKGESTQSKAFDYVLRPILFIVQKGSPQSAYEGRMREAEGLRARFQSCDEGIAFTRGLKDVAVRDSVTRTSADLPQALRDIVDNTTVGRLTKPEVTQQGIELFALCEKRETSTDTPQKRAAREQIFNSKYEAQSARYLKEARKAAMIEYK